MFSGGVVSFGNAKFSGGRVGFGGGVFSGGRIEFSGAEFSGGEVDFSAASDWSVPPRQLPTDRPPQGLKLPKKADQSQA